ncbi:GAP family protein [Leifsonia poae]|uniref:GAP family protein n=1 Tax=Leifsonia poae TaxID=110933 RepID=UPI001CBA9DA3|nr:GAP family protein [Leifsonia poae]
MNGVIGEILPSALGIAVSPIPIIAAILMLLSPKARGTSVGFLIGWILGIVVAVVVFTLLSAIIPAADPTASKPIAGVIKIILGLGLLLLAWNQWRKRPARGETAAAPKWMAAIDTMKPAGALGLAFVLAAINPKNLLMAVAGGLAIGGSGLVVWQEIVAIVIFVVIAACTVLIPVVAYLVAAQRIAGPLDALRGWLLSNNATIMTVLLLVIGVVIIGKGIASF